jgi:hypothetical protein
MRGNPERFPLIAGRFARGCSLSEEDGIFGKFLLATLGRH